MPESFPVEVEVVCPFCDGKYYVGGGRHEGEKAGVIHTVPPCAKFLRLDVLDFLREARLELVHQGKLPKEAAEDA